MKVSYLIWGVSLALLLAGCNQKKLDQLTEENQRLKETTEMQDSLLNDFLRSFNAVEDNLAIIREREGLITMNASDPELQQSGKAKVIEDILLIDQLLLENKEIIENLNNKLSRSNAKLSEFRRMVDRMKGQLQTKDNEIVGLKQELVTKNFEIENLSGQVNFLTAENDSIRRVSTTQATQIAEQTDKLQSQDVALNTAFYISGTFKELRDKNILLKEGGFAGIGRTPKLREDLSPSEFTKIDIREIDLIPLGAKKAKVLTSHPAGSYEITGGNKSVDNLKINDAASFWQRSKYLVVLLD